jgi:ribosomal protein L19
VFQGTVIAIHRGSIGRVRSEGEGYGVGVERQFRSTAPRSEIEVGVEPPRSPPLYYLRSQRQVARLVEIRE